MWKAGCAGKLWRRVRLLKCSAELPPEERLVHLRKFIESHAGNTGVLSDEAMDRESIYADRGL